MCSRAIAGSVLMRCSRALVRHAVPRDLTGGLCLDDDRREIAPLGVTEKVLEIAREPEFDPAIALLGVALERVGQSLHNVGLHAPVAASMEPDWESV